MATLYNVFLILAFTATSFAALLSNSTKFCIRHDSTEIKDEHRNCEILATAFTPKENEIFFRTMCKDHVKNIKGNYSYFKLRHGVLEDRQSFKNLCDETKNPLLAWVPYESIRSVAKDLDKKEVNLYIAKATDETNTKTELCYFSQSALLSNETSKFGCALMIFDDKFFGRKSNINVLVEVLPIYYEVRNVTYEPWTNVTYGYKTRLASTSIQNWNKEQRTVYGSIAYGYVQNINVDVSTFFNDSLLKLPLAFHYEDSVIELDKGSSSNEVKEKAFFGRKMDPNTSLRVDLIGQWSELHRVFRASLYENFGNGISHYKQPIGLTKITILKISNTEEIYENSVSILNVKDDEKSSKFTQGGLGEVITNVPSKSGETKSVNHPYPGFYPYFVVACVIISLALIIPIWKIIVILKNEREIVKIPDY